MSIDGLLQQEDANQRTALTGTPETQSVLDFFASKIAGPAQRTVTKMFIARELLSDFNEPHMAVSNCRLINDLKSDKANPNSAQLLLSTSLSVYKTIRELIDQSSVQGTDYLRGYVNDAVERLERDLACDITTTSDETTVKGMSKERIKAIPTTKDFPAIDSPFVLKAYEFVLVGSNMGARKTSIRFKTHFGLDGSENGGAEFLHIYMTPAAMATAFQRVIKSIPRLIVDGDCKQKLSQAAVKIMKGFEKGFLNASSNMPWLSI